MILCANPWFAKTYREIFHISEDPRAVMVLNRDPQGLARVGARLSWIGRNLFRIQTNHHESCWIEPILTDLTMILCANPWFTKTYREIFHIPEDPRAVMVLASDAQDLTRMVCVNVVDRRDPNVSFVESNRSRRFASAPNQMLCFRIWPIIVYVINLAKCESYSPAQDRKWEFWALNDFAQIFMFSHLANNNICNQFSQMRIIKTIINESNNLKCLWQLLSNKMEFWGRWLDLFRFV